MHEEHVLLEHHGPIAHIVLNRPDKLNALTSDMYVRIGELLKQLDQDPEVRVVVLRGNGRAFSAGFDLNLQVASRDTDSRRDFLLQVANDNRWRIWNSPKPVVAKLQGYCLAGALELVLPCDFIVAAEDCELGEPEILFGAGAAYLMIPWLVDVRKAKHILMTGQRFSAAKAAEWGLITMAVAADELDAEVEALASHLAKLPPAALKVVKQGINRVYEGLGMRAAIDSWVDSALLLGSMETEEVRQFKDKVEGEGVKAAIRWRDELYQELHSKSSK